MLNPIKEEKKANGVVDEKKELKKEWKVKKEEIKEEKSLLVQVAFHAQNENNTWYVDSGCSNHMTRVSFFH